MDRFRVISLQPAEIAKVATIMMMGRKLEEMEGNINTVKISSS